MKKTLVIIMALFSILSGGAANANEPEKNAYDFVFKKIEGGDMPLAEFKGKVLMVVNTASHCGFTGQYEDLQKLYAEYQSKGLEIIAVPSADFGNQEFGANDEIKEFCETKFAVTFPLAEKEVVSGDNAHPFYKWAGDELGFGTRPKWNFHKYLVDKNGKLVDHYNSTTNPNSASVRKRIDELLAQ